MNSTILLLRPRTVPPNKSLLRTGGQWYLVCKEVVVMDKLPVISLGEPPGAELNRYAPGTLGVLFMVQIAKGTAQ
jgi:hypothetical protein